MMKAGHLLIHLPWPPVPSPWLLTSASQTIESKTLYATHAEAT